MLYEVITGIEPCCETIYDGIEFNKDLNSSSKINVGLDIIDTISKHYGFKAPIFIDNAESVNKLINIETQLITLHVSLDNKLMVIEAVITSYSIHYTKLYD